MIFQNEYLTRDFYVQIGTQELTFAAYNFDKYTTTYKYQPIFQ